MGTLLHHVKPWMQKSIADFEARMAKRLQTMMDQKVQAVHKLLDAFELRVHARPAPFTDISSIRAELDSLRTDFDSILAMPTDEPESEPTALADDTVLDDLLNKEVCQQKVREGPHGALSYVPVVKVPTVESHGVSTTNGAVRMIDNITEGAVIVDVGTTEGGPNVAVASSGKSNPPAC
uniref:Integrase core domain containing protein n=1 Tax=Solanum tuberosum TaxID=4113 RepID=M1DUW0_SOLTU